MVSQKLNITLPTSWAGLSEKQLYFASGLLYNKVPETELLTLCFLHFAGLRLLARDPEIIKTETQPDGELCYWFKSPGMGKFYLSVDVFASIIHKLDFLITDVDLFKNPAKIAGYTGCNFKLYGLTLEEWLIVDQMYIGYAKTQRIEFIDNMLAVLYHLPSEKWDETADLSQRAARFAKVPVGDKYIIFLWYTACKMWLRNKYPFLFETSDSNNEPQSANDFVMGLLSALNEGNVANNPLVKRTPCHEVFYELNRKIEKAKTF